MFSASCNDCQRPIAGDDNHFFIPNFVIIDAKRKGDAHNLHFCNKDCLLSWVVKSGSRPQIITPNGPAQ